MITYHISKFILIDSIYDNVWEILHSQDSLYCSREIKLLSYYKISFMPDFYPLIDIPKVLSEINLEHRKYELLFVR